MQQVDALLAHGFQIGSDRAEGGCPIKGPETAGDLLFNLWHPHRLFCDVVGEEHLRIREETQDVLTIFTQASQQIGRSGLPQVRGASLRFLIGWIVSPLASIVV